MAIELAAGDFALRLRLPAIAGFALMLPFVVLEAVNTSGFQQQGFPLALFIVLWMLPMAFTILLTSVVRSLRAGSTAFARPFLLLSIAGLVLIAWFWGGLVADQMPCFLGVPNCD